MTDAERELLEMMMATLCSLQGMVTFHPKALENLLAAINRYQQERAYLTSQMDK